MKVTNRIENFFQFLRWREFIKIKKPLLKAVFRAGDRTRTGDSLVGNERLYQLSYSRNIMRIFYSIIFVFFNPILLVEHSGVEPLAS